jgi:hypothetical protein
VHAPEEPQDGPLDDDNGVAGDNGDVDPAARCGPDRQGRGGGSERNVVVEELTFRVEAELLDAWLAREAGTWDNFLRGQPGFLRKEVWLTPPCDQDGAPSALHGEAAETVRVLVWWADRQAWKAVPDQALGRLDDAMGTLLRASVCREFRLLRRV